MRPAVLVLLVIALATLAGCSSVPNLDGGNAGCNNARGIGRPDVVVNTADPNGDMVTTGTDMDVAPQLRGKTVAQAGALARAAGHTVVFRVEGDGSCWCVTPPGGTVTDQWYGEHGALWLWVVGAEPSGDPGFLGHGC
jgi:uncharacterized protein YceK